MLGRYRVGPRKIKSRDSGGGITASGSLEIWKCREGEGSPSARALFPHFPRLYLFQGTPPDPPAKLCPSLLDIRFAAAKCASLSTRTDRCLAFTPPFVREVFHASGRGGRWRRLASSSVKPVTITFFTRCTSPSWPISESSGRAGRGGGAGTKSRQRAPSSPLPACPPLSGFHFMDLGSQAIWRNVRVRQRISSMVAGGIDHRFRAGYRSLGVPTTPWRMCVN